MLRRVKSRPAGPRALRAALLAEASNTSAPPTMPNPSAALQAARSALQADIRQNTSSRSRQGTAALVAKSVTDQRLQDALRACSRRTPCGHACCPLCARRRGVRYYHQTLLKAGLAELPPDQLRWLTINVCETDDLDSGSALLAGREHEALKHIIATLRKRYCWLRDDEGNPLVCNLRVWGAREVEPLFDPASGSVKWRWHWHIIVDLDGLPEDRLEDALRTRWPAPRAVNIARVEAEGPLGLATSLRAMACYGAKARYTYRRSDKRREWLPSEIVDQLARWMVRRGSRWSRFALGCRDKPKSPSRRPRKRSTV